MRLKKFDARQLFIAEIVFIIVTAFIPLFVTIPYRINIYLTWEGAYRLYQGQVPFEDFGLPMGYAFWLIPTLFFYVFGPLMSSLLKAQVFINIIAGLAFSGILKIFKVPPGIKFAAIVFFCLSYSLQNVWPWYNHTVVVYQIIALYFVLYGLLEAKGKYSVIFVSLSALFSFLSFFSKQDGGALTIVLILALVLYYSVAAKKYQPMLVYVLALLVFAGIFIGPALTHNFSYWFNYGQPPHYSRLNIMDFLNEIFMFSQAEKFYIVLVLLLLFQNFGSVKVFFAEHRKALFFLLTLGILVQALLIQVTSYIPPDVNIYFHSFALAYIFANINFKLDFEKPPVLILLLLLLIFWYSQNYWQYGRQIILKVFPSLGITDNPEVISKNTWNQLELASDTLSTGEEAWIYSDLRAFDGVTMPVQTVEGINKLKEMPILKKENLKVLNMSELTPLAHEFDFKLETGPEIPLWYHKNVAIFDKEIADYCRKIGENKYDLVLFEVIPFLNNFYPEEVRDCLQENYEMKFMFLAPRQIQNSYIEVYVRPKSEQTN